MDTWHVLCQWKKCLLSRGHNRESVFTNSSWRECVTKHSVSLPACPCCPPSLSVCHDVIWRETVFAELAWLLSSVQPQWTYSHIQLFPNGQTNNCHLIYTSVNAHLVCLWRGCGSNAKQNTLYAPASNRTLCSTMYLNAFFSCTNQTNKWTWYNTPHPFRPTPSHCTMGKL